DAAVWAGTQFWTDEVWISRDPSFDRDRAIQLGSVSVSNATPLAGGASYSRTVEGRLPPGVSGDWFVYVFTNTGAGQEEWRRPADETTGSNSGNAEAHRRYAF